MKSYIINKNDLYTVVKVLKRLPDAYDAKQNGIYNNLFGEELEKLNKKHIAYQRG